MSLQPCYAVLEPPPPIVFPLKAAEWSLENRLHASSFSCSDKQQTVSFEYARLLWPSLIIVTQQTIWLPVAAWRGGGGGDLCNHRYRVTIDTKAVGHVTTLLSYCRDLCEPTPVTPSAATWIWSASWVGWSHCGWPSPSWAGAGGRRRGSPPRTSTGACSSWSWLAGTQRCAPARGPAEISAQRRLKWCLWVWDVTLWGDTPTWSSSSTTTKVRRLFLKSSRVILGLKRRKI